MYAVVETGGKQVRVREGDSVQVERLDLAPGDEVVFDRVLCLSGEGRFVPGYPTVDGAVVRGLVESQGRGRKIIVFRYKAKANERRKTGHRQSLTTVRIVEVREARGEVGADDVAGQQAGENAETSVGVEGVSGEALSTLQTPSAE